MNNRGYLLMEAMLGSAVLAVTLSVAAGHIGAARQGASYANHRQIAVSLAHGKADEAISGLPASSLADAPSFVAVDASRHPGFQWMWTTSDAGAGAAQKSVPPIEAAAREVVVEVSFPAERGSRDDRATPPIDDGRASVVIRKLWFQSPLPL